MLGLAGSGLPVRSQVVKGATNENSKTVHKNQVKTANGGNTPKTDGSSKLNVNQQTLRQQNGGVSNGSGKQADTMTPSAYCNKGGNQQVTKGSANKQLTPPPPGGNPSGGNQQVTKGGNLQVTKGNQQVTKGSQQVTKGSAVQTTAAAGPR